MQRPWEATADDARLSFSLLTRPLRFLFFFFPLLSARPLRLRRAQPLPGFLLLLFLILLFLLLSPQAGPQALHRPLQCLLKQVHQ